MNFEPVQMTLLVTGSRDWPYRRAVEHAIDVAHISTHLKPIRLMHGGCPTGADAMAHSYATHLRFPIDQHNADWERFGRSAGPIRNREMIELLNTSLWPLCIAFNFDNSRGTRGTLQMAQNRHLPWKLYSATSRNPGRVTYCDWTGRSNAFSVPFVPAYTAETTE